MHPPGKEKGTLPGASLNTDYDATNVTENSQRDNSKSLPPGFGFDDAGAKVPFVMPPGEAVPLSKETVLLRTIAHACQWSQGEPVRWQSFLSVAGFDSRPLSEIAESLRVSPRLVQLRVAECKTWLAELRAELEARP